MKIHSSPGICFDTETTGVDPKMDRVVEVGAVRYNPAAGVDLMGSIRSRQFAGKWSSVTERVNPLRPIPPQATEIHRIRDEDVVEKPPFTRDLADRLEKMFLKDGWVGGYNAASFDAPLLNEEIARTGSSFRIDPSRVLDGYVFVSWHMRGSPSRKLEGICAQLRIPLGNAHSTADDSEAALKLILALVEQKMIPDDLDLALEEQARITATIGEEFARWSFMLYNHRQSGEVCIGFGKHCGKPLRTIPQSYLSFVLKEFSNVPPEAAAVMRKAAGL